MIEGLRRAERLLPVALVAALLAVSVSMAAAEPRTALAIVDFTLTDTSGEVRDQGQEHDRRLNAAVRRIQDDLARSGEFRLVDLTCGNGDCTDWRARASRLLEAAKQAGADLVLVGGVHKTSTLVLGIQARVVDVRTGAPVFARWLSFRGDTDEAWQRAAAYLARELAGADLAAP